MKRLTSEREADPRPRRASDPDETARSDTRANRVARLHRSVGNQAIQSALEEAASGPASRRLARLTDEGMADRAAEQVMADASADVPIDQRLLADPSRLGSSEGQLNGRLERLRIDRQRGEPLPSATRAFFERRFGRDFGDVRLHTGATADAAARSLHATAFAYGRDIAFRSGAFQPDSPRGRHLLAHELTHVVQQRGRPATVQRQETTETEESEETAPALNPSHLDSDGKFTAVLLAFLQEVYTPEAAKEALALLEQSKEFRNAAARLDQVYEQRAKRVVIEATGKERFRTDDNIDWMEVQVAPEAVGHQALGIVDDPDAIHRGVQSIVHETSHAYRIYERRKHAVSSGLRSHLIDEKRTRQMEKRTIQQIGAGPFDSPGVKPISEIAFDLVSGADVTYLERHYLKWAERRVEANFEDAGPSGPPVSTGELAKRLALVEDMTLRDIANVEPLEGVPEGTNRELKRELLDRIEGIEAKIEAERTTVEERSKNDPETLRALAERIAREYLGISQRHANLLGI